MTGEDEEEEEQQQQQQEEKNEFQSAATTHLKKKKTPNDSRAGYPFATLVDFASDGAGFPIFNLSPLAMHTRNLLEDPRACLVVETPCWMEDTA